MFVAKNVEKPATVTVSLIALTLMDNKTQIKNFVFMESRL
jgi:hypothetical protein